MLKNVLPHNYVAIGVTSEEIMGKYAASGLHYA